MVVQGFRVPYNGHEKSGQEIACFCYVLDCKTICRSPILHVWVRHIIYLPNPLLVCRCSSRLVCKPGLIPAFGSGSFGSLANACRLCHFRRLATPEDP